jgi:short-subunit dehydrogenase
MSVVREPADVAARTDAVLVIGATSPIARCVAVEFAKRGHDLLLTGRDPYELGAVASDLSLRYGIEAHPVVFDALDFAAHGSVMDLARQRDVEGTVVALGHMGDQVESQGDFEAARSVLDTNYTACVSLLEGLAAHLEERGRGFICAVGSVAGDRGRQSNYVYGSAKAGLAAYLQGLRNRLHPGRVTVTTVKPGFVDTRMTYGKPGVFLVATPESVGRAIHRAICAGRSVVYVPWFWRWIMAVIKAIPEPVFKRMKL